MAKSEATVPPDESFRRTVLSAARAVAWPLRQWCSSFTGSTPIRSRGGAAKWLDQRFVGIEQIIVASDGRAKCIDFSVTVPYPKRAIG